MSLLIVIATGGMNFFLNDCVCDNVESVSLIYEEQPSCCSGHDESLEPCDLSIDTEIGLCDSKTNCCNIITKFVKIEDNYLVSSSNVSFEVTSSMKKFFTEQVTIYEESDLQNISHYLISLPPMLSGKSLVFFLQKLQLDLPAFS